MLSTCKFKKGKIDTKVICMFYFCKRNIINRYYQNNTFIFRLILNIKINWTYTIAHEEYCVYLLSFAITIILSVRPNFLLIIIFIIIIREQKTKKKHWLSIIR